MLTRTAAIALALVLLFTLAVGTAFAGTTRYNPRRSGHPLRVIAYAVHPIGVIADTLVFHPAWWVGKHEPFRTLFGVEVVIDDSADVAREMAERNPEHSNVEPPPLVEPDTAPEPEPTE